MKTNVRILYLPRAGRGKKQKTVIYCRVSIRGLSKEFSTYIEIPPFRWDALTERILGDDDISRVNNLALDNLSAAIKGICLNLELSGRTVTPELIINTYHGPKDSSAFLKVMSEFIAHRFALEKPSGSTMKKYDYYCQNIANFLVGKKIKMLPASEFKIPLANALVKWVIEKRNAGKTHAVRHVELCSRALDYAVVSEFIAFNPLASFKIKRDPGKAPVSLEHEEIVRFLKHDFHSPMLQVVADLWLFQCGTGLSYADIYDFQVITEKDKRVWIVSERGKNGNGFAVPLFPLAAYILNKYKGHLPRITNQQYNRVLKEVAGVLGIRKKLTTHIGRKTFASIKDAEGWSTESIAQMLGHKSVKTTETHYLCRSKKRIIKEMERLGI